ncbi:hypothetical protein [Bacteroides stercoris]|jgi:hypothetical protein|uniref:Uncharacterized protein n=1 Tax=Bacteroides stercoris TaxID=46506 RepID=A0A108T1Z3_BACSE|nr:hypothetical protein [Bacteroides stercoris]KWR51890.1 hypothetical protein AA415_03131 [Bacteroides stercoris]
MKKIMFNDKYSLTQAVLNGRKTMTRRVCKYDRPNETYDIVFPVFEPNDYDNDGNIVSPLNYAFGWKNDKGDFTGWNIPKYKVGEVCAIAQSYETIFHSGNCPNDFFVDSSTINKKYCGAGFKNKLFVRADFMPHHIRITNIKIQRLQEISNEDCLKEGIIKTIYKSADGEWGRYYWHHGVTRSNCPYGQYKEYSNPLEAFASLIDCVSGKGTFKSNPYVFVYEFELVD